MEAKFKETFTALFVLLYTKLTDRLSMSYTEIFIFCIAWFIGGFIYVAAKNYFKMLKQENG